MLSRSEASRPAREILRFAQDDKWELSRLANAAVRESIVMLSRSEASRPAREILRFAQDDTRGGSLG